MEYEAIIQKVLREPDSRVYIYQWETTLYPTVVADVGDDVWLVMVSMSGVMETAFMVDRPGYLDSPDFTFLGLNAEVAP